MLLVCEIIAPPVRARVAGIPESPPRARSRPGRLGHEFNEAAAVKCQREIERLGVAEFPQAEAEIVAAPAPLHRLHLMALVIGHFHQCHAHPVRR